MGVYPTDDTILIAADAGNGYLLFCRITQEGVDVANSSGYVTPWSGSIVSQDDLLTHYSNASMNHIVGGGVSTFTKHALFDLAVNNSPAYHAFDEDPTTEWVSHSNRYDVSTGDFIEGFTGTPPGTITFHTNGGWVNTYYWNKKTGATANSVRYQLYRLSNNTLLQDTYGATFTINTNNELVLDVNDTIGGSATPTEFKINGGTAVAGPHVVAANDDIELRNASNNTEAHFTVPSELTPATKLASTTDAGEFLKISLDSSVQATTLNLKSVAEYKEPRINMTGYNQCGYEVTASSEYNTTAYMAWQVYDNLRTGSPNIGGNIWASLGTSYDSGNSFNANTARQLATDTEYGEWVKLKLPDKRKLVAYKLSRQDGHPTVDPRTPRKFRLYGSNDDLNWTEITGSAVTRAATDPINSYSTGLNADSTSGSRFELSTVSPAYQYFALVIEQTHGFLLAAFQEFELFCQPAEIEEFKLYGSPDDAAWTEIHAQTSANITSSGTDFAIDSPGSYQHYGLVITKNYGYNNVSLSEMQLGVPETVDLTNYYTKPEVDSLIPTIPTIPKGVLAEGSFTYVKNNSNSFAIAQANFFAASSNIGWTSSNIQIYTRHFGNPATWAYAPSCRQLIYQFTFTSPILDDAGQETSEYKVMLTRRDISLSYTDTIYELAVYEKTPDYFKVRIELEVDTSTYHIETHGFDFVVF